MIDPQFSFDPESLKKPNAKLDALFPTEEAKSGDLSNSPWAKMFPSGATKEQMKMFIDRFLKDMIVQIQHDDEKHKELMARLKQEIEDDS